MYIFFQMKFTVWILIFSPYVDFLRCFDMVDAPCFKYFRLKYPCAVSYLIIFFFLFDFGREEGQSTLKLNLYFNTVVSRFLIEFRFIWQNIGYWQGMNLCGIWRANAVAIQQFPYEYISDKTARSIGESTKMPDAYTRKSMAKSSLIIIKVNQSIC